MITGIGHTAFRVADMETSLDFYCKKLGLKHAFTLYDKNGKPWIEYIKVAQCQFIELFYGRNGENTPASYSHLCLEVSDINEIAEHMKKVGIKADSEPSFGSDGNWQCWVTDPDGNRIEFMQIMPDSKQKNC